MLFLVLLVPVEKWKQSDLTFTASSASVSGTRVQTLAMTLQALRLKTWAQQGASRQSRNSIITASTLQMVARPVNPLSTVDDP